MADPVKVNAAPKGKTVEDLQADQNKFRDELSTLRSDPKAKPEDVKSLKAKLADAVAATRAAEEAQA